jgi:protein-tyrosine-phosphatase
MPHCLFVCTANICRSPMAEKLFQYLLQCHGFTEGDWHVSSAGTWAEEGQPAASSAIEVIIGEWGLDLKEHKSRRVDQALIARQDLVLVMEKSHLEAMRFEFADQRQSIFLLSQMIGQNFDIEDPYASPLKEYRRIAHHIDAILSQGFYKICQLAQES